MFVCLVSLPNPPSLSRNPPSLCRILLLHFAVVDVLMSPLTPLRSFFLSLSSHIPLNIFLLLLLSLSLRSYCPYTFHTPFRPLSLSLSHSLGHHCSPTPLQPNKFYTFQFDLHFTTWTFDLQHKIRVAVSNSAYRLAMPTPLKMTTTLAVDHQDSFIKLPFVTNTPADCHIPPPFTRIDHPSDLDEQPSDAFWYNAGGYPRYYKTREYADSTKTVTWIADYYQNIRGTLIASLLAWRFTANSANPALSRWDAESSYFYVFDSGTANTEGKAIASYFQTYPEQFLQQQPEEMEEREGDTHIRSDQDAARALQWANQLPDVRFEGLLWFHLRTELSVWGDAKNWHSRVHRWFYVNGTEVAEREWNQVNKRMLN